jgi:hypothetical protein
MGGPIPMVIKETKFINNSYHITVYDPYAKDKESELIIHLVDNSKNFAIWEFKNGTSSYYRLLIPVNQIRQYPIIATDWYGAVWGPNPDFESINFEKLLNQDKVE